MFPPSSPFPRPPTLQSPSRTVQRLGGTELASRLRRSAMTAWGFHSHAYTWEVGRGGEGGGMEQRVQVPGLILIHTNVTWALTQKCE